MALQTSIAQYFTSRKRRAGDEIKASNTTKVLILDKNETDVSDISDAISFDGEGTAPAKKIVYNDSPKVINSVKSLASAPKLPRKTPKTTSHKKLQEKLSFKQGDIRKSLLASFNATLDQPTSEISENIQEGKKTEEHPETSIKKVNVPFEIKGAISPRKALSSSCKCTEESCEVPEESADENCVTPKKSVVELHLIPPHDKTPVKKESISQLRAKLIKSNRLDEIKNALNRLKEGQEKLQEIESKIPPKSPSLKKFKTVEIEVTSPTKKLLSANSPFIRPPESPSLLRRSLLMSPGKSSSTSTQYISPRKLFTESSPVKAAAFERHAALVARGKPSLPLPYKYRSLAETFRAVDTVVSLLFNKKETIHFSKLKASVQQMTKRNLTETHLGQIDSVCPNMFSFRQEKLRHVPGRADVYELVVTPIFDYNHSENEDSNKVSERTYHMTPTVLHERKRKLYQALLEKTKDYHQEFLSTLDPPIVLDRNMLTRWHPEFDVDGVPDLLVSPMPQPPNVETFSSAKDVLSKAREMFFCNPRMEKALEKISKESQQSNTLASASIPALTSALKGIPSSLLEKVRAKQAAKAAECLTRNPLTAKRRVEYSRLPELARIVRNVFVGEKKNILPKTLLLTKLNDSFREVLTPSDLEYHLKLLMECSSGWLTTLECRKEAFYKISKNTDLSQVLTGIQNSVNKL